MKKLYTKMVDLKEVVLSEIQDKNIKAKFDCENQIAILYKEGDIDKYIYLDLREDLNIPYLSYSEFREFLEDFAKSSNTYIYGIDEDLYYLEANEDKEDLENSVKQTIEDLKKLIQKALKELEEEE